MPWSDALLQALPYARRLQLERAGEAARTASLAGLALALTAACRIGSATPRVADFRFASEARPTLQHGPVFSVSHTDAYVACVACTGAEVGLDIERLPPHAGASAVQSLLRWTATEATLKAAGLGLRHVRDVVLGDGPALAGTVRGRRYRLLEIRPAPQVLGHLASVTNVELHVDRVALDGGEVSAVLQRALGLAAQP